LDLTIHRNCSGFLCIPVLQGYSIFVNEQYVSTFISKNLPNYRLYYFVTCLSAEFGVGLGWPYLGVKYNFSQRLGSELRWATGEGINVYAGRGYWNYYLGSDAEAHSSQPFSAAEVEAHKGLKPRLQGTSGLVKRRLQLFTGLEGGYISFDTLDIKGTGYEGAVFFGGEYFIFKNFSFALDFAPTFIGLKSDEFKIDGVEWVANLAVYYYFTRNRHETRHGTDAERERGTDAELKGEIVTKTDAKVTDFVGTEASATARNDRQMTDVEKRKLMSEHYNKAGQLYQQKKYEEAIKEWQEVLKLDPEHKLSQQKIETARKHIK
ncbi:MAG: tetratricopeptide repeat protein, partial [Elusimicrobiota bacterium]